MTSARRRSPIFIVGPREHEILAAHGSYHLLNYKLLGWLLDYSPNSARFVQKKLQALVREGYLLTVPYPRFGRYGKPELLHALTRKGVAYLQDHGLPIRQRFRPSDRKRESWQTLQHTLELNAVLIGIERYCRRHSEFTLHALRHERDIKGGPIVKVEVGDGKRQAVYVDAWLDIRQGDHQFPVAIEFDRGSENQAQFRRKVRALLAWALGPYETIFHTPFLTIAVIATAGDRRATPSPLVTWTEAELTALGARDHADWFRFTTLPPAPNTSDLEQLLSSPCWRRPFDPRPQALLDGTLLTEASR